MIGQLQSPLVLAKIEPTSPNVAFGSFSTEASNSAARPTSASPQKLTSVANVKLVAMGQGAKRPVVRAESALTSTSDIWRL
jgi:hypothetical protein